MAGNWRPAVLSLETRRAIQLEQHRREGSHARSRIWGGIHYRFDIEASQVSCTQVADYLFDNYMRPNRAGH